MLLGQTDAPGGFTAAIPAAGIPGGIEVAVPRPGLPQVLDSGGTPVVESAVVSYELIEESFMDWLKRNKQVVYWTAGGLVAFALLRKRR